MHFIREFFSLKQLLQLQRGTSKWFPGSITVCVATVTFCCWLLTSIPCLAQNTKALISLSARNKMLREVFREIEQKTGYSINYQDNVLNAEKRVTIDVSQKPWTVVLEQLLNGTNATFKQQGNMILLLKKADTPPAKPATGRITGKIMDDETGEPLPLVTIRIGSTGATSNFDGSFNITLPNGKYSAEISSIGYGTKVITDIDVNGDLAFVLNATLKRSKRTLNSVVVTSSARKETANALYARQKNEAGIINGISREQISALPDKNIGETLKRISGVSTNDNRRVVVRGIAERYNLAMMDGAVLPSTDVQVRDFEFDIIPSNLIDNVIVSKTATPDMSFGFGGGLIQINTFAIPNQNFTTIGIGSKYTNGSTGKDFLGYGRGKTDFLGLDDGSRDHFPKDLLIFTQQNYNPTKPYDVPSTGVTPIRPDMIAAQNKKIGGLERIGTRIYKAQPGQNYQVSLGRVLRLKNSQLGFVSSLSFRNEQSIDDISHTERGDWEKAGNRRYNVETGEELQPTYANQYNYNTTWAALLNLGWSSKHHKITSRNFYSRVFNNQFTRTVGYGEALGYEEGPAISEFDRPKFLQLLQNRINGEHTFGAFRFDWNISRNKLTNHEKDAVEAWLKPTSTLNGISYNIMPSAITNPGGGTFNRAQYSYEETNKVAEAALSYRFKLLGQQQTAKAGYQYMERHGIYDWTLLPIGAVQTTNTVYPYIPVQEWGKYLEFKNPLTDLLYYPASFSQSGYEGKNTNQAFYGMMDNRFANWLRFVWGIRAESYQYERLKSGANDLAISTQIEQGEKNRFVDPETGKIVTPFADPATEEKKWRYLPSANLTVTPFSNFNIRAAYAQSVVRPALIENSRMVRFDPAIGAIRRNEGVLSTLITHYDFRLEWYPNPGEVISVGYFHKYFDKPVELYRTQLDASMRVYVVTQNSDWAKVNGLEFDLRKSLGFINPGWKFLDNIFLNGNLTLQTSDVQASQYIGASMGTDKYGKNYEYRTKVLLQEKRPLFGQIPVLYNIGLQYAGNRFGTNVAFNHMGYKTFITGLTPDIVEYERARNQLDAQLSYDFLKDKKLKVKLNFSNLLNSPYRFYINSSDTYQLLDKWKGMTMADIYATGATEWKDIFEWKPGFSQKYDEGEYETSPDGKSKTKVGDKETFIRKVGTSFSLSLSYTF
ncbi:TonB-dependent receptor [Chitinophaga nivalis]|uniref:Carboxypeptidase-like regulatory domain-containing protein n=1 Tax=Chitinophaga nivalis TaxID=2991709 RepID=A0ABT3IPK6_9BACT|nr:carboxypeptidase-like regulatory domain-containing protein [Chitinophaga nivalis]MCW3464483.1 carboxypeptidase-like regulatory domain-containing protein [Chitinophaga nivalis]MCW3485826.1 carboxypeptidase-like regulatory domain-containing protein [Chitinophaga nivalis]